MDRYRYKAINQKGRSVRGVISAANEQDLSQQLEASGLTLVQSRPMAAGEGLKSGGLFSGELSFMKGEINTRDLMQTFTHLSQMIRAGIPLLECLSDLRDASEKPIMRDLLSDLHRGVTEGQSLSRAMQDHPKTFKPLMISIIGSGEETGDLPQSFDQLAKHLKWADSMQAKIRKATVYPSILLVFVLVAVTIMMTLAVPQIVEFLEDSDRELPIYTVSLMAVSNFFVHNWWAVLGVPLGIKLFVTFGRVLSSTLAYNLDMFGLHVPVIGPVVRKINIARFAQTFSATFSSGVDILKSLEIASTTVTNIALSDALEGVQDSVRSGSSLAEAMKDSGEFPMMVVRMVKVGENAGTLPEVLTQVSEFYAEDVDEEIQKVIAMIEPFLTIVLGGMMLWIVLGTFGPIYGNFDMVSTY